MACSEEIWLRCHVVSSVLHEPLPFDMVSVCIVLFLVTVNLQGYCFAIFFCRSCPCRDAKSRAQAFEQCKQDDK